MPSIVGKWPSSLRRNASSCNRFARQCLLSEWEYGNELAMATKLDWYDNGNGDVVIARVTVMMTVVLWCGMVWSDMVIAICVVPYHYPPPCSCPCHHSYHYGSIPCHSIAYHTIQQLTLQSSLSSSFPLPMPLRVMLPFTLHIIPLPLSSSSPLLLPLPFPVPLPPLSLPLPYRYRCNPETITIRRWRKQGWWIARRFSFGPTTPAGE